MKEKKRLRRIYLMKEENMVIMQLKRYLKCIEG